MNQILTDEEITLIIRECARGSAINRDGSTSHRIARAIEQAILNKLSEQNESVVFHLCEGCGHYYQTPVTSCDCMADLPLIETTFFTHPASSVPEGMVLVPLVSTPAMRSACREARAAQLGADTGEHSSAIWNAMLSAARSE